MFTYHPSLYFVVWLAGCCRVACTGIAWESMALSPANDRPVFSKAQCDALFAAVLVHDDVDLLAELPDRVHLDYSQSQLHDCYRICRQLWQPEVAQAHLKQVVNALMREGSLSPELQLEFKHVRAKFKHLRFAFVMFSKQHRYPPVFHRLVIVMGRLQDAFKHAHPDETLRYAWVLRLFLLRLPYALAKYDIDRFQPTTAMDFRVHVLGEMSTLGSSASHPELTSKEFHETRKIISRLVALYDNLRIVLPSAYHDQVTKYLSTINGLMGQLHDELIERKLSKTGDYYADRFAMQEQIRTRLLTVAQRYGALT